jgi:hypothetical protein
MLGLAARHEPTSYWDIVKKDNPRKARRPLAQEPIGTPITSSHKM